MPAMLAGALLPRQARANRPTMRATQHRGGYRGRSPRLPPKPEALRTERRMDRTPTNPSEVNCDYVCELDHATEEEDATTWGNR